MSLDVADDLHAAEDLAGLLASALADLLVLVEPTRPPTLDAINRAINRAHIALGGHATYCRPTCGHLDTEDETCECDVDDPDPDCPGPPSPCSEPGSCGCPCGHPALTCSVMNVAVDAKDDA